MGRGGHFGAIGGSGLEYYNFSVRGCPCLRTGRIGSRKKEEPVAKRLQQLWNDERGQDIAEYAVMLAVILVIVVGTIRLIGSNANNVFSQVGSAIQ
jgi:Flp pilus assembly pilin Flp